MHLALAVPSVVALLELDGWLSRNAHYYMLCDGAVSWSILGLFVLQCEQSSSLPVGYHTGRDTWRWRIKIVPNPMRCYIISCHSLILILICQQRVTARGDEIIMQRPPSMHLQYANILDDGPWRGAIAEHIY
eukprot:scaffold84427_cov35-Attheya_sp.AAC.3